MLTSDYTRLALCRHLGCKCFMQKLTVLQTESADRMSNHGGGYAASQGMCWAFMPEALLTGTIKVHALGTEGSATATLMWTRSSESCMLTALKAGSGHASQQLLLFSGSWKPGRPVYQDFSQYHRCSQDSISHDKTGSSSPNHHAASFGWTHPFEHLHCILQAQIRAGSLTRSWGSVG